MLLSYIVFNVLNVVIQTVKSIVTIKCNKWIASIVNAVAYGLYTYIVVLTTSDLDLWFKIVVAALSNLVGVFIVKYLEEKKRKTQLWKIEFTVNGVLTNTIDELLKDKAIKPKEKTEAISKWILDKSLPVDELIAFVHIPEHTHPLIPVELGLLEQQ